MTGGTEIWSGYPANLLVVFGTLSEGQANKAAGERFNKEFLARWIGARVGVVNIASNRLTQRVDLHLALGGSFETATE